MTVLEIVLLVTGIIAVIASFLIPDKKSGAVRSLKPEDYEEMKRAFHQEITQMLAEEKETLSASVVEESKEMIQDYMEEARQGLARMSRDQEQQVHSMQNTADTIIGQMNERYNEVSTLYAMLSDKHTQVDGDMERLEQLRSDILMIQGKLEILQEETRQVQEEYEEKVKNQMLRAIGQTPETVESEDGGLSQDVSEEGEAEEEKTDGGTRIFDTGKVAQAAIQAEQGAPDISEEKIAQLFQPIETEPAEDSSQPEKEAAAPMDVAESEPEAVPEEETAPSPQQAEESVGPEAPQQAEESIKSETPEIPEENGEPIKVPEKLLEALRDSNTIETEIEESVCRKALQLYEAGFSSMEISQSLKIGIGQVRMIVDLYTGREIDH